MSSPKYKKKLNIMMRRHDPSKQSVQEIQGLNQSIKCQFQNLIIKYKSKSQNQQQQLFRNYLSVLDRLNDQLITQQQRYKLFDKQKILEKKCNNLYEEIFVYRQECYRVKQELRKYREQLKKQKQKKTVIKQEIEQLRQIAAKKEQQVYAKKISYQTFKSDKNKSKPKCQSQIDAFKHNKNNYINANIDLGNIASQRLKPKTSRSHFRARFSSFTQNIPTLFMYKLQPKTPKGQIQERNSYTLQLTPEKNWK